MPDGHRIPQDANDWMRSIERRLNTIERRPAVMSREQILGAAVAPLAMQVLDWNSPDVLLNGWYWSEAPAANGPTLVDDYMGTCVVQSLADGSLMGIQRLTRVNRPEIEWTRTFVTQNLGAPATFGSWRTMIVQRGSGVLNTATGTTFVFPFPFPGVPDVVVNHYGTDARMLTVPYNITATQFDMYGNYLVGGTPSVGVGWIAAYTA